MKILNKYKLELIIFLLATVFSSWLMFSTFSYNNGFMEISTKAWSDFASHIPLIRSFSFGDNFPTQYPLFSGPPIRYHFLFYAMVGFLEKLGLNISYALNIPSIIGFSLLTFMIYIFSKEIFKSKAVGAISIFLFLFNGSFSFLKYFSQNTFSFESLVNISKLENFVSFGPYDQSIVSAFWNLNIYTNQRHLGLSYFLCLLLIYFFIKHKYELNNTKSLLLGLILGISFLLNMAVFLMTVIILITLFIFLKNKRKYIFITVFFGSLIALPFYLNIQNATSTFKIMFHAGYLLNNINFTNFLNYWIQNLGLHFFILPLIFLLVNKEQKRIFISFFVLFLIANLIQFSPEIAANHKFINLFMIVGAMYTSYFLVYLWKRKENLLKPLVILSFIILIFSGILDLFPILNDKKISLADYPNNKTVEWITRNTKPSSIFLNTNYLYDDASLAGRKIFLGWPYFAWSQGYDTLSRDNLRKSMLSTNNKDYFCRNANLNKIDYVEVNLNNNDIIINKDFLDKNLLKVFENKSKLLTIYKIGDNCL
jgi:hypothetical protein